MLVWGMNFAFVKYILSYIGVGAFLFMRFTLLTLLGFVLLAIAFRGRLRMTWPRREDLPRFVGAGLVGHAFHVGLVMYGMNLSTAFSSSLVLTSSPLFTLALLAGLGAEPLRRRQVAGTLVAFAGIVLFLSDKFVRGRAAAGIGDLVLLSAAALFSLYTVMVRPLAERYGALIVLSYTLLFSAPLILAFTFVDVREVRFSELGAAVWLGLAWAIVFSSFCGWLMWTWVNTVRGVARTAPFQYLMPPIAGVVAWLTLGEAFTWLKIAGAGVTMSGVAWAQLGGGRPPPKEAAQPDAG